MSIEEFGKVDILTPTIEVYDQVFSIIQECGYNIIGLRFEQNGGINLFNDGDTSIMRENEVNITNSRWRRITLSELIDFRDQLLGKPQLPEEPDTPVAPVELIALSPKTEALLNSLDNLI